MIQIQKAAEEIDDARRAVEKAQLAYRRGTATVSDVNRANTRLANAHNRSREVAGGRVHDDR